ncbi:hypothetical protein CTI12_AA631130 [Artemisia annua]|uniref:Uncharacterized protein n=1 Tax=Artemisia annua TaxID=35608 RepID=A0A2U1K8T7_ARTAN|nr:hypothetical protein CTI12_AA631130 [Artemisia annua]
MEVVDVLKSKGVKMVPFKLNYTVESAQGILNVTMDVDMLAHFDNWQRSGKDNEYEAQDQWPTELRRARVIPAVDYVQALALTMAYQSVTDHHKQRPPIDDLVTGDTIPNPPKAMIPPRILRGSTRKDHN